MTWPNEIYVATENDGVYYTDDFSDPSTQPTWSAINTGLAATDCREFWLDPFDQADRQYVLLEASRTLYRRESGGSWSSILTSAQAGTICSAAGGELAGFHPDPSIDGRVWAVYGRNGAYSPAALIDTLYSDDHGDNWSYGSRAWAWTWAYLYGLDSIRCHGDYQYIIAACYAGSTGMLFHTDDGGSNWNDHQIDANAMGTAHLNSLTPSFVYHPYDWVTGSDYLSKRVANGSRTDLQAGLGPMNWGAMWFDADNADHQRMLKDYALYVTNDSWSSVNSPSSISGSALIQAPFWEGQTDSEILIGRDVSPSTGPYDVIAALTGESDTTADGIAGSSPHVAPYTDSIPDTCGGPARMGIQAVGIVIVTDVYTYDVAFERAVADIQSFGVSFERGAGAGVHTSDVEME